MKNISLIGATISGLFVLFTLTEARGNEVNQFEKSEVSKNIQRGANGKDFKKEASRSPVEGSFSGDASSGKYLEIKPINLSAKPERELETIRGIAKITAVRSGITDSEGFAEFQEPTLVQLPLLIQVVEATANDYAQLYFESLNAACVYSFKNEETLQLTSCSTPRLVTKTNITIRGKVGIIIHSEHLSDKTTLVGNVELPIEVYAPRDTPQSY